MITQHGMLGKLTQKNLTFARSAGASHAATEAVITVSRGIESGSVPQIDAAWHALDVPSTSHCRVGLLDACHRDMHYAFTASALIDAHAYPGTVSGGFQKVQG